MVYVCADNRDDPHEKMTDLEHLDGGCSAKDLEEGEPDEHLTHGALSDSGIVQLGELQVARVHGLGTGELENILHHAAEGGKHSNTAVLELGLTEPAGLLCMEKRERTTATTNSKHKSHIKLSVDCCNVT